MGNYESLRIGVDLSVPCDPDSKSLESAFQKAAKWTDVKLDQLTKHHKGEEDEGEDDSLADFDL
jgi:hypothetical protein